LRQQGVARGTFKIGLYGLRFLYQHTLPTRCGFSARSGQPVRCWNRGILALTPDSRHAPLFLGGENGEPCVLAGDSDGTEP
jgi:hypothetical protein